MRKIVAGIQARMGSQRLPGKSMVPLASRPLIEWVIRRVRMARRIDEVYLLTSTEPADDPLVRFAEELCPVIRGSLHDVRSRYLKLFTLSNATDVIRVTGDCPLLDGRLLDILIDAHVAGGVDYSHIRAQDYYLNAYPNGMNGEIFTRKAFDQILQLAGEDRHREHVTLAVDDFPEAFRRLAIEPPPELDRPGYKLSVDRQAELDLVKKIVRKLDSGAMTATIDDIVLVCDQLLEHEGGE